MLRNNLQKHLRFCFITDDSSNTYSLIKQVKIAIISGSTLIRYLNRSFSPKHYKEAETIRKLCYTNSIPLIVESNILLAKAIEADGIHLNKYDESPEVAREILGCEATIGFSFSAKDKPDKISLAECDYIEISNVCTEKSGKKSCPDLLSIKSLANRYLLPIVVTGGIDGYNIKKCLNAGAKGVGIKKFITRSKNPYNSARKISSAAGCEKRPSFELKWDNEFDLINMLISDMPYNKDQLIVPPGDDAALLASLKHPVITTDTQKEGIHFKLCWQTPEEVGAKAVEIAFSDLAASYARPVCLFVNLSVPSCMPIKIIKKLYKGIKTSLFKHHASLGGGNVSASKQLSVDLFAIGEGRGDIFPTRSGAKPGDGLYCTGPLGLARAGLYSLTKNNTGFKTLIDKFKSPSARFDASRILANNNVRCVMDLSDGLAGDAEHIAKASNITIALDLSKYSYHNNIIDFCNRYKLSPEKLAFAGGEDYELLFACSEDTFKKIIKKLPEAFNVGSCMEFNGKHITGVPSDVRSYHHGDISYLNL